MDDFDMLPESIREAIEQKIKQTNNKNCVNYEVTMFWVKNNGCESPCGTVKEEA